jgi:membrane associated rhomboid family serine protease
MDVISARMTPTVQTMIVVSATISGLFILVRPARPWIAHLAMGQGFLHGEPWQAVTGLFTCLDFVSFLFALVGLWFVAASIERDLGRRRFLTLFFGAGVLANVAAGLVAAAVRQPVPAIGNGLAVLGLIVTFGRLYRRAQVSVFGSLVFPAYKVAWFWVLLSVLIALLNRDLAYLAGVIVASAAGYFLAAPGGLRQALDGLRARRARQRYKVLEGGLPGRPPKTRSQKYWN